MIKFGWRDPRKMTQRELLADYVFLDNVFGENFFDIREWELAVSKAQALSRMLSDPPVLLVGEGEIDRE